MIGDAVSRMQTPVSKALELSSPGMLTSPAENILFEEILNDAREHFKTASTSNHWTLPIKKIIELQGGRMWAESDPK